MIKFRGNEETVTVEELVAYLLQFPSDMPVVGLWEGQLRPVDLTDKGEYGSGLVKPDQYNEHDKTVLCLYVE